MTQLNEESTKPISTRLKKAQGQIAGVIKMLDEGRDCEEIVTQLAALNKAISRAGYALVTSGLNECYTKQKNSKQKDVDLKKIEKLFLALA
jgi:DNA-binding FrmR family transcriptional regulator